MKKGRKLIVFLYTLFFLSLFSFYSSSHAELKDSDVTVSFCQGGKLSKKASLEIDPKKREKLCINVTNINKESSGVLTMYFVDGFVNPITPDNISCRNSDDEKKGFSKFSSFRLGKKKVTVTLKPDSEVKVYGNIDFPSSYVGYTYGCLITEVGAKKELKKGKLNFVMRKGNTILANIKGNPIMLIEDRKVENIEKIPEEYKKNYITDNETAIEVKNDFVVLRDNKTEKLVVKKAYENKGNIQIDISLTGSLTNSFGFVSEDKKSLSISPGEKKNLSLSFDKLPWYDMGYEISLNEIKKPLLPNIGGNKEDFDETFGGKISKQTSNVKIDLFFFPSIIVIILVIVILIIFVIFFLIKKKKKKAEQAKISYTVQEGDTINSIAAKFACSWKDISKLNNIQAPYILTPGTNIYVYNFNK